jgi:hypothetical protein
MLLSIMENFFIALVLLFFISQVFIPLFRGTVLFPYFRKELKLQEILAKEKQKTVEKQIQEEIKKEKGK